MNAILTDEERKSTGFWLKSLLTAFVIRYNVMSGKEHTTMFKLRSGSTRVAVVLFNRLVLKFPRCYGWSSMYAWGNLKSVWKSHGFVTVWKGGLIGKMLMRMKGDFLLGVSANVCEGWMWLSEQSTFLHPTFCLVVCNLQRHAGDTIPTYEQMKPFFESLPKEGRSYLGCIDPHQFYMDNWRIVDGRLRLIDYGGKLYDSGSFPSLLLRWKKEIEEELSKPVA